VKTGTPPRPRLTALTPIAIAFTLVSLCWTGWSITDLVQSGKWGILAAVSVDGLWGVVQYLSYKGIGGRFITAIEWTTLGVACGLLAWHGWNITHAAAFAGALPPIVAKIAWTGDVRLRRDPTALTADQEAEINNVIRDSEYIARRRAAEIEREAAEEIALIRAQGKVAVERDEVTFQVELERIRKRDELSRRTPLGISASNDQRGDRAAEQEIGVVGEQPEQIANRSNEQITNSPLNRPNADPELPSLADLVREQIASTPNNTDAINNVMAARPDANRESVAASVRRERRKSQRKAGPYL
jgi:hypothetical protein